jgi:hypothetical protein
MPHPIHPQRLHDAGTMASFFFSFVSQLAFELKSSSLVLHARRSHMITPAAAGGSRTPLL